MLIRLDPGILINGAGMYVNGYKWTALILTWSVFVYIPGFACLVPLYLGWSDSNYM